MKWCLIFLMMMPACVVRQYGGSAAPGRAAATQLPSVDFSAVETDLEDLISAETENVDRRDRLEAAWSCVQESKTQRPAAQHSVHRYLTRLVEVERRIIDADTSALADPAQQTFVPIASIQAKDFAGDDARKTPTSAQRKSIVPPDAGATAVMEAARERMATGDLEGAIDSWRFVPAKPVAPQPSRCGEKCAIVWYTKGVKVQGNVLLMLEILPMYQNDGMRSKPF